MIVTILIADIASYQDGLTLTQLIEAGVGGINVKVSHALGRRGTHPDAARWITDARAAGLGISTFHWLDHTAPGAAQARHAHAQMLALGALPGPVAHVVDCESSATEAIYRDYVSTMTGLLGRPIVTYSGAWWWRPRGWTGATAWLWAAPNAGYQPAYPGDTSEHWAAGYGGWDHLAVMQWAVTSVYGVDVSMSAARSEQAWAAMRGVPMVMDPRTHPRGTPPDFTLPRPNPNPSRMTDPLWWLVCMRLALEPKSRNGGTFADKPGSHNVGENLPDHGQGATATDHSIRDAFNRTGPWWRTKTAAHDWTFVDAQAGDYTTITKYTRRLLTAMRSDDDVRPDDVYFYTLGQADDDLVIEGYNERDNEDETSSDDTHLWHRHDSFRRNIVGSWWHMWQALTIDMGWTYAEWQRSTAPVPEEEDMTRDEMLTLLRSDEAKAAIYAAVNQDRVQGYDANGVALPANPAVPGENTMTWASALAAGVREARLARRDLRELRAVVGVDTAADVQRDAALAETLRALPGAVAAELADEGGVEGQAVTAAVERALGRLQLVVAPDPS